jgi:hypothetical protein
MLKIILILLLTISNVNAKNKMLEKEYQAIDCEARGGKSEVTIKGGRIDCETKYHVIEYDFANKWAECLGQIMYYSKMKNKIGLCVLIVENNSDYKYVKKLEEAISYHQVYISADVIKNLN